MSELDELIRNFNLSALAVIGSRARGDNGDFSDLDLIGVGEQQAFHKLTHLQHDTELHICTHPAFYEQKPGWWYALEDMKIVLDDGSFAKLLELLPVWRSEYKSDASDIERNRYWLESSRRKLKNSHTELRISYEIATAFWQILSGSFLVRDMPVPANSDMLRLAPQVIGDARFNDLLVGDCLRRKAVALEIIDEVTLASK